MEGARRTRGALALLLLPLLMVVVMGSFLSFIIVANYLVGGF